MSLNTALAGAEKGGFPRVSGDEPGGDVAEVGCVGFSPRERG